MNIRQHRGSILIFTLWVLVCLSLIALGFGRRARLEMRAAAYEMDRLTGRMLAHAAINAGIAELQNNFNKRPKYHTLSDEWAKEQKVSGEEIFGYAAGDLASAVKVTYRIVDEERKVNINLASKELLDNFGLLPRSASAEILIRRSGKDGTASGDDLEFGAPEELLQLGSVGISDWMGNPDRSIPGLRDLVTVHGLGKININTAPEELIAAIPGLHTWAAEAIVENRPFKDFSELEGLGGTGMGSMSQIKEYCVLASFYFTIIGKARMHDGRVVAVARAVVFFPRGGLSRPRTLAWREG